MPLAFSQTDFAEPCGWRWCLILVFACMLAACGQSETKVPSDAQEALSDNTAHEPISSERNLDEGRVSVASLLPPEVPTAAPAEVSTYSAEVFYQTTNYLLPAGIAWSPGDAQLLVGSDSFGTFNVYALDPDTGVDGANRLNVNDSLSNFLIS